MDTAVNQFVPLAGSFGGWEIILILCVVLILLGAKNLPRLSAGLGSGLLDEFKKATDEVADEMRGDEKTSGLLYEAITANNRTAEFVYPEPESPNAVRGLILFLAQGFGVGRIPFAPGTLGSIVGVGWFAWLLGTGNFWFYLAGTLAGVAAAVWLCGAAEKILKQTDPPSVVLDEIVAVPICFLPWVTQAWFLAGTLPALGTFFSGQALWQVVLTVALFRLFDIAKPWPIRGSQRLPGGWGVVTDDVLAAIDVALVQLVFFMA